MTLLPRVESFEEYKPLYRQSEVWLPAVRAICQRHGLDAADLRPAPLRLVTAYGLDSDDGALRARITSYCLLHRYGHIGQFLERVPAKNMREFEGGLWS